jgi:hypothetical protein
MHSQLRSGLPQLRGRLDFPDAEIRRRIRVPGRIVSAPAIE